MGYQLDYVGISSLVRCFSPQLHSLFLVESHLIYLKLKCPKSCCDHLNNAFLQTFLIHFLFWFFFLLVMKDISSWYSFIVSVIFYFLKTKIQFLSHLFIRTHHHCLLHSYNITLSLCSWLYQVVQLYFPFFFLCFLLSAFMPTEPDKEANVTWFL